MGVPPLHEPTPETRELVERAAGYGLMQEQIAAMLPPRCDGTACNRDTIRNHYAEEWARGRSSAVAQVARSLFMRATGEDGLAPPDVKAQMWYLERRGGDQWKPPSDVQRVEVGPAGAFARLADAELEREIAALEARLVATRAPMIEADSSPKETERVEE